MPAATRLLCGQLICTWCCTDRTSHGNADARGQGIPAPSCLGCGLRAEALCKQCPLLPKESAQLQRSPSPRLLFLKTHIGTPKNQSIPEASLYNMLCGYPLELVLVYEDGLLGSSEPSWDVSPSLSVQSEDLLLQWARESPCL